MSMAPDTARIAVSLVGVPARTMRLIELVMSNRRLHPLQYALTEDLGNARILILGDGHLPLGLKPEVLIRLGDETRLREPPYALSRNQLLSHLLPALDDLIRNAGAGSARACALVGAQGEVIRSTSMRSERALIVDDSLAVRLQLQAALASCGLLTEQASCADSALRLLCGRGFDLVFLDIEMPGMNGFELCREIRRIAHMRGKPILMLSSHRGAIDHARAMLAGSSGYLHKPIDMASLRLALAKHLGPTTVEPAISAPGLLPGLR